VRGIKVGMKTDKDEKILKKTGGTFEKSEDRMSINYSEGLVFIGYSFKNGKITSMSATLYVGK